MNNIKLKYPSIIQEATDARITSIFDGNVYMTAGHVHICYIAPHEGTKGYHMVRAEPIENFDKWGNASFEREFNDHGGIYLAVEQLLTFIKRTKPAEPPKPKIYFRISLTDEEYEDVDDVIDVVNVMYTNEYRLLNIDALAEALEELQCGMRSYVEIEDFTKITMVRG